MIKLFEDFILESKNYPIYKGVTYLYDILKSNTLKSSGEWDGTVRKNIGINYGISVTRNFVYSKAYGNVIEFDTQKLSDNYRIIPFSENPDYYLWYMGDDKSFHNIESESPKIKGNLNRQLRDKKYGKEYWAVKTNKKAFDFGIAEELIIAKEIPNIVKYIKKIYITDKDEKLEKLLNKLNIPYEIINYKSTISDLKHKNKRIKAYSQI